MTDPRSEEELEAAELRGRLRGRWKAERRVQEHEALHEHRASRDLVDALRETMARGDEVVVHLAAARPLTGQITAVGQDYVAVRPTSSAHMERHIQLPVADAPTSAQLCFEIRPGQATRSTESSFEPSPPTFQGVLQQYDFHQQADPLRSVEIGTTLQADPVRCTLLAHAGDHLVVKLPEGHEMLVPVRVVTYIAWASSER